jgi:hypothetical protein
MKSIVRDFVKFVRIAGELQLDSAEATHAIKTETSDGMRRA